MMFTDPAIIAIRSRYGGLSAVARATGLTRQAIALWTKVKPEHVHAVAPIIGMSPTEIRPDIFLPPNQPRKVR